MGGKDRATKRPIAHTHTHTHKRKKCVRIHKYKAPNMQIIIIEDCKIECWIDLGNIV